MIRRTEGSERERGRRRREMDASSSGSNKKQISSKPSKWRASPISSLGTDHLSAIFSFLDLIQLIRCSIVCKSWNNIIFSFPLMRNLYYARNSRAEENPNVSLSSMRRYLEDLAMEQHKLGFLGPSAEIHQWNAHSVRISLCRMKRGQILTGGVDKVLRLWSAESYSCLDEYVMLKMDPLVDYDFDENKIVGLASARLSILRRNGKRSVFQFSEGSSTHGLCMRYIDPEAVVGCDDGRVRVLDMYSGSCSRIIRMHGGPVTCMSLTEEQLMFGGSTFGTISVADLSTGELLASLKSSFSPTGIRSMNFNTHSHLLFAGSTSGYAHCWDIRTLRPLWETRVSPNVIYSVHHLPNDTSTLAVGGLDGVLRILDQNTGEVLSSFAMDASATRSSVLEKKRAKTLPQGIRIDSIPRCMRPPITSLAVGLNKIVTAHNDKYINLWRFCK